MISSVSNKYKIIVHISYQDCGYPEENGLYIETNLKKIHQAVNVIKEDSFGFWCKERDIKYRIDKIDEKNNTITIVVDKTDSYPIEDMCNDLETLDDDGNYPIYYNGKIYLTYGKVVGCKLINTEDDEKQNNL